MNFSYFIDSKPVEWDDLSPRQQSNAASMEAALIQKARAYPKATFKTEIKLGFQTLSVEGELTNDAYKWGRV